MARNFNHILITGASSGIGAALALQYAIPGVMVSLTGRHQGRLEGIAARCRQQGADVNYAILDVRDRAAMMESVAAFDRMRPIDLAIANAGISGGTGGVMAGESMEQTRHIFDVNVQGVFNTVESILPFMLQRAAGQVAIISSLAGFRGWPGAPAYCASKAAVKVYGEGLRGALRKTGVGINVICPGFVRSGMTAVNDFSMPFLMDTPRAALIIARGLARNKGRICFPWQAYLVTRLFCALPDELAIKFLSRLPAKQAQQ